MEGNGQYLPKCKIYILVDPQILLYKCTRMHTTEPCMYNIHQKVSWTFVVFGNLASENPSLSSLAARA